MHKDLLKPYDHSQEGEIYEKWQKSGFFNPDNLPVSKIRNSKLKIQNFSIIMPPPNANGSLHVGHAVMVAVEDLMVRFARLRGKKTLWLPGADHAGFETQVVYEKKLEKEGTSRFEILNQPGGREKLYQMIWEFTQANKSHMENQVRRLGASCDWSREKFTLDPKIVEVVYDTFKKLYEDGLIYRDKRIVNWCPKHQTTLSDLEVKYEERTDPLYYIKYGPITLATVRLETKFGDTAIAVNPRDKRYKAFVGKELEVKTLAGKTKIKVIADEAVDMEFGTGAVKVTPAHDADDYAMWLRHKDEIAGPKEVIDRFGRLDLLRHFSGNEKIKKYHGLKIAEARALMAEDMQKEGLMEKIDASYKHNVSLCYKCGSVLEPRVLDQWFIDLTKKGKKAIVEPAINAVKKGKVKILPAFQEKIFFHWMRNIRDWNISRQIVWGIPIPAGWCKKCDQWTYDKNHYSWERSINPDKKIKPVCVHCGETLAPDGDVFDTWFSSGQWPFATLLAQGGSSPKVKDFGEFYPTQVMETGYDILFFWVARMIMLGLYRTGKVPFETVYLHGLVRDKDKQKMSKSKGNVVDPLGVVDEFGADALRMALIVGNSPGQDVVYDENKIRGYRNFSNKIWNLSRFIISHTEKEKEPAKVKLLPADAKLLKQSQKIMASVAKDIERKRFSQAAETAYHYVWHTFADKIIESKKSILASEDEKDAKKKQSAHFLLYNLLLSTLIMLHPFMPFVTEAVYQRLPGKKEKFLMVEEWK